MAASIGGIHLPHDPDRAVFMLSGGIDSLALLISESKRFKKPHAVYMNLGQKSAVRQEAAVKRICHHRACPLTICNLAGMAEMFFIVSEPPHPMVAELFRAEESMKPIAIAAAFAASSGAQSLFYGATTEDVNDAPFLIDLLKTIEKAAQINTGRTYFSVEAPLATTSRADALKSVPAEMHSMTWSCLWGGLHHCGQCRGCTVRQQRFADAKIPDPTVYSMEYMA